MYFSYARILREIGVYCCCLLLGLFVVCYYRCYSWFLVVGVCLGVGVVVIFVFVVVVVVVVVVVALVLVLCWLTFLLPELRFFPGHSLDFPRLIL